MLYCLFDASDEVRIFRYDIISMNSYDIVRMYQDNLRCFNSVNPGQKDPGLMNYSRRLPPNR